MLTTAAINQSGKTALGQMLYLRRVQSQQLGSASQNGVWILLPAASPG